MVIFSWKEEHIKSLCSRGCQLARVRGGLMPMSYPVNPEREYKTAGEGRSWWLFQDLPRFFKMQKWESLDHSFPSFCFASPQRYLRSAQILIWWYMMLSFHASSVFFVLGLFTILCLLGQYQSEFCCARFLLDFGQDCGNRTHGGTHLSDTQPVMPSEAGPMESWLLQPVLKLNEAVISSWFRIERGLFLHFFQNGGSWCTTNTVSRYFKLMHPRLLETRKELMKRDNEEPDCWCFCMSAILFSADWKPQGVASSRRWVLRAIVYPQWGTGGATLHMILWLFLHVITMNCLTNHRAEFDPSRLCTVVLGESPSLPWAKGRAADFDENEGQWSLADL